MATTVDLIARLRDLVGEETADLYTDATEMLPALNDGKNIIFNRIDVLPKLLDTNLVAAQAAYTVTDLGRIEWLRHKQSSSYTEMHYVHAHEVESLLTLSGDPKYYTTEMLSSTGVPQITVFPTPPTGISGSLYGYYFAIPADLAASGSDPTWHTPFHFLPCYHAAAVLLRKDRRPEAANEMELKFEQGLVRYERWYLERKPYRKGADAIRSQADPNDHDHSPHAYPWELKEAT